MKLKTSIKQLICLFFIFLIMNSFSLVNSEILYSYGNYNIYKIDSDKQQIKTIFHFNEDGRHNIGASIDSKGNIYVLIALPFLFAGAFYLCCCFGQRWNPFVAPLPWVVFELLASNYILHFPASMSLTQSFSSPYLLTAKIGGGIGISYLILLSNFLLASKKYSIKIKLVRKSYKYW
ncbi:MAG: hypothetical protein DKM50_01015 [Candidatus Margulisiibacteriota bacterium]|nr:MAG: hypothetical protein A2X43_12030 [Candidatus Margulisbacteria bacterium GWD2_39_127]OGI03184.1 MAG: hypothetical protein A2X42_11270 [Candidatus Margulisbacteria bacterium GWF2_38_17]OGI11208.1 MAG: hypothetical protein A2X41_03695 [Candidatus Margulisbacteria bacterium GWE2_39_32]PZM83890.1 MAG: hypothetical protein DKM50_01015 [Candidatus Margulisiibacteriota bacterium]HAR63856.1 hypothetical protein [Candidatus Margulisiibacteriota bacterium]